LFSSKSVRLGKLFEAFNTSLQHSSGSRVTLERFKEVLHVLEAESFVRLGQKDMVTRV
jgi:hypothetical protein